MPEENKVTKTSELIDENGILIPDMPEADSVEEDNLTVIENSEGTKKVKISKIFEKFKIFLNLADAAFLSVANDLKTSEEGYVLDARQGTNLYSLINDMKSNLTVLGKKIYMKGTGYSSTSAKFSFTCAISSNSSSTTSYQTVFMFGSVGLGTVVCGILRITSGITGVTWYPIIDNITVNASLSGTLVNVSFQATRMDYFILISGNKIS